MADINYITSGSLAEVPKAELQPDKTLTQLETTNGEAFMLRLLVEKINELVKEVNILKNN